MLIVADCAHFRAFINIPRENSVLSSLLCVAWSEAWSSVAVAVAVADVCFRMVWARIEAGTLGWWKSVMTSFLADYWAISSQLCIHQCSVVRFES